MLFAYKKTVLKTPLFS